MIITMTTMITMIIIQKEPDDDSNTYKISGTAWIDSNANGQRDSEEAKISNMPVVLINGRNRSRNSAKTKEDGSYSFEEVKQEDI